MTEHQNVICLDSIGDNPAAYRKLFSAYKQAELCDQVELDLSHCSVLSHSAVAFLLGWSLNEGVSGNLRINFDSAPKRVYKKLLDHIGWFIGPSTKEPTQAHAIPYGVFEDSKKVVPYLREFWLEPGWINLSAMLKDALAGRTWEIFTNALEHSGANQVYCCGEHLEDQRKLKLAIVDFGIGIPGKVNPHLKEILSLNSDLSAITCLKWAMRRGTSTGNPAYSRGIGIDLLKEMVKVNNGRLDIYSHNAHASVTRERELVTYIEESFHGTLVNIMFRCDDFYYQFEGEDETTTLF